MELCVRLVWLLIAFPLLESALMIYSKNSGHCVDHADRTVHRLGSRWRNSDCQICQCLHTMVACRNRGKNNLPMLTLQLRALANLLAAAERGPHSPILYLPLTNAPNTVGNLAWPIHLIYTSLACGRKPEHQEETHADTGRMCKLHTDSCLSYSTPQVYPDDCIAVFERDNCRYRLQKKSNPMVECQKWRGT
ncbi:uncharacterized protein [Chiloscyllium punctatum]|uniref:uncharacterized protein n=1 Tax=Chiloscyllium punctatum TaxID=137246 RepID=UPI003B633E86